jgi:hypothetical protein
MPKITDKKYSASYAEPSLNSSKLLYSSNNVSPDNGKKSSLISPAPDHSARPSLGSLLDRDYSVLMGEVELGAQFSQSHHLVTSLLPDTVVTIAGEHLFSIEEDCAGGCLAMLYGLRKRSKCTDVARLGLGSSALLTDNIGTGIKEPGMHRTLIGKTTPLRGEVVSWPETFRFPADGATFDEYLLQVFDVGTALDPDPAQGVLLGEVRLEPASLLLGSRCYPLRNRHVAEIDALLTQLGSRVRLCASPGFRRLASDRNFSLLNYSGKLLQSESLRCLASPSADRSLSYSISSDLSPHNNYPRSSCSLRTKTTQDSSVGTMTSIYVPSYFLAKREISLVRHLVITLITQVQHAGRA